jgi:dCMP deaminase
LNVGAVLFDDAGRTLGKGCNRSPENEIVHGLSCESIGHNINESGGCIRTVHAEMDAMVDCIKNLKSPYGANLYTTHMPCYYCSKTLIHLNIQLVIYENDYVSKSSYGSGKDLLKTYKVKVLSLKEWIENYE